MYVNLRLLLAEYKLDEIEVGRVLFPKNKNPSSALSRVLRAEQDLNTSQIFDMCYAFGLSVSEVFNQAVNEYTAKDFEGIERRVLETSGVRLVENLETENYGVNFRSTYDLYPISDDIASIVKAIKKTHFTIYGNKRVQTKQ